MKALRQVLASLHSSIVTPVKNGGSRGDISVDEVSHQLKSLSVNRLNEEEEVDRKPSATEDANAKKSLVEMYDSKKKRREEESQAALKFNQKAIAGLKFASECGHLDADDPADVARYLLQNKDIFEKAQIGEFLGREKEWQDGFALKVLRAYGDALDFKGMPFDDAIRYYLSGFRLPGEAQKVRLSMCCIHLFLTT
jgi:Sec7-like guanine-nucleotide exchange factor